MMDPCCCRHYVKERKDRDTDRSGESLSWSGLHGAGKDRTQSPKVLARGNRTWDKKLRLRFCSLDPEVPDLYYHDRTGSVILSYFGFFCSLNFYLVNHCFTFSSNLLLIHQHRASDILAREPSHTAPPTLDIKGIRS